MRTAFAFAFLILAATATAFEAGSRCFANKTSVPLLSAPDRASPAVGQIPFATEVRILETNGRWIRVKGQTGEGWAFAGNLSPQKPPEENKSNFLPTAGDTGAAVAARPLSSAAREYADRKSHGEALGDLQWMETLTDTIHADAVKAYQQEAKRGEFAP